MEFCNAVRFKVKEGCEEEFEFFMKHGYHKVGD